MASREHDPLHFDSGLVQAVAQGEDGVVESFRVVEAIASEFYCEYYEPTFEIPDPEKIEANGGHFVDLFQSQLALFHLLQARRIAEHLADLIQLLNGRHLLAASLTLRAMLEVVGAVVYYVSKMKDMLPEGDLSDTDVQSFVQLLDRALRGGRFNWNLWASGEQGRRNLREAFDSWTRTKGDEPMSELGQTNILTMIQHLAKHMGRRDEQH